MTPFDSAVDDLQSGAYPVQGYGYGNEAPGMGAMQTANQPLVPKEKEKSFKDYTIDALLAPFRGVVGAGASVYDLADTLSGDLLPDQEFKKAVFGDYAESTTLPGQIIEGVSEFATGFIPGLGIAGKLGAVAKASKIAQIAKAGALLANPIVEGAVAGGIANFAAFDPHAQRLSNLLASVDNPLLNNAVTQYLSSNEKDSDLEGRFKNAIEGVGFGLATDALFAGLKAFKARKLAVEAGKTGQEVEQATLDAVNINEIKNSLPGPSAAPKNEAVPTSIPEPTANSQAVEQTPKIGETTATQPRTVETPTFRSPEEKAQLDEIMSKTLDSYMKPETLGDKAQRITGQPGDALGMLTEKQTQAIKNIWNVFGYREGNNRLLLSFVDAAKEKLATKPMSDQQLIDLARPLALAQGKDPEAWLKVITAKAKNLEDVPVTLMSARFGFDSSMQMLKEAADAAVTGDVKALNDFMVHGANVADMGLKIKGMLSSLGKGLRAGKAMKEYMNTVDLFSSGVRKDLLGKLSITDLNIPGARKIVEDRLAKLGGRDAVVRAADKLNIAFADGNLKAVNELLREGRWINAHNEFWINAILSGPKTALVNTLGNTFTTLYLPLEGAVGAVRKGNMGLAKEFISRYGYLVESINDASRIARLAYKTNSPKFISETFTDPGMGQFALSPQRFDDVIGKVSNLTGVGEGSLNGFVEGLAHFVNTPTRFLMATDEFFKQINARATAKAALMTEAMETYAGKNLTADVLSKSVGKHVADRMEILFGQTGELFNKSKLYREAYDLGKTQGLMGDELQNFMQNTVNRQWESFGSLGKISEYAEKVSREATFQTELEAGSMARGVQDFVAQHPVARLAMPFTRTPLNILKFAGQRMMPLDVPLLRSAHKRMVADLASGDPRLIAEATGRFWMGGAISFSAAMLGISGAITGGGPNNEEERKLLEATGWRPYSIKMGNEYVSFQRLDPFATFLGLAADLGESARRMDRDEDQKVMAGLGAIALAIQKNVVNKSYMAGLERVMEAINSPERFLPKLLKSQIASYVPSVIGQAVPTIDPETREARTIMDSIMRKVPGMSGFVDKKRNVLGESVELPLGKIPFGVDYLSPIVMSSNKKDKVMDELSRLQYGFSMPRTNLGGGMDLRDVQNSKGQSAYDRWMELHQTTKIGGRTLRQQLTALIGSSSYQRLSDKSTDKYDSPRIASVRKVIGAYRDAALKQTLKEFKDVNDNYNVYRRNKLALKRGISVDELMPLK